MEETEELDDEEVDEKVRVFELRVVEVILEIGGRSAQGKNECQRQVLVVWLVV